MLSKVDWKDYEIEGSGSVVLEDKQESRIGRVVEESIVSNTALAGLGVVSMAVVAAGWLARGSRHFPSLKMR